MRGKIKLVWLLLAIPVFTMTGCMTQVPAASVAVLFDGPSGKIEAITKPTGMLWVWPLQELVVYPTSIKNATFVRNSKEGDKPEDDSIKATTKEGAILPMDITVAWHVEPGDVRRAFMSLATADLDVIQQKHIRWATMSAAGVVAGRHSIFDLISKDRSQLGPMIKIELQSVLTPLGITVNDVYVGEVYPDQEIQSKISESLAARNDLAQKKNELTKAGIEKRTAILNAQAQAEQNRLLGGQGENAIKLKRLQIRKEAIAKWDGVAPIVGDPTVPFTGILLK